ncbi:hypothetical protein COMNV_00828 [Commensalibacter sp. Nvir]|uniref:succinate dehydrogenase assembly factor 2 n=1 Tax=Commensalibacter sp. Nvir TaxID=3069817 RepID=UPI002D22821E|nr:hypothetical protein COMNV_00828 [Commensalibacter sp. Nvir]
MYSDQDKVNLEIRKRRLLYQANHRGTYEADLLVGRYVSYYLESMNAEQLDELERILLLDDVDLTSWLTGAKPIPKHLDTMGMLLSIKKFAQ